MAQLQDPRTTDKAAKRLIDLGRLDPKARSALGRALPPLIHQGPREGFQAWANETKVAGELQLAQAVPALVKWINAGEGVLDFGLQENLGDKPAARALSKIGDPAIPAVIGLFTHPAAADRWEAVYVLNKIGSRAARAALRSHLKREPDPRLRERIRTILASK